MRVFVNKRFAGYWPVGTAAVVMAESANKAAKILEEELIKVGLPQKVENIDMVELSTGFEHAYILHDGNC